MLPSRLSRALSTLVAAALVLVAFPAAASPEASDVIVEPPLPPVKPLAEPDRDLSLLGNAPGPFDTDPWIANAEINRALGTFRYRVVECTTSAKSYQHSKPPTAKAAVDILNKTVSPYFKELSRGKFNITFVPGKPVKASTYFECSDNRKGLQKGDNGVVYLTDQAGSFGNGSPGWYKWSYNNDWTKRLGVTLEPNTRYILLGADVLKDSSIWPLVAHEVGHTLGWHHVPAVKSPPTKPAGFDGLDEYNSYADVMSRSWEPIGTAAVNRYAAGWIPSSQVQVWDGKDRSYVLGGYWTDRTQMVIVPTDVKGTFFTVSARPVGGVDSSSQAKKAAGVEVHFVDARMPSDGAYCVPDAEVCTLLGRRVYLMAEGGNTEYGTLQLRESVRFDHLGAKFWVGVTASGKDSFTVEISRSAKNLGNNKNGGGDKGGIKPGAFSDVSSANPFAADITWMAKKGITAGCNPPQNTKFCPDARVTRGQMAAFLVRALNLKPGKASFQDTKGSVFAADVAALADAGITKGCNPPQNTKFCPNDYVTRGQMAAFLTRALGLNKGKASFQDTKGSPFAADIAALADSGITKGCNPPRNDRFCPNDYVTRGQMAAFLHRALEK